MCVCLTTMDRNMCVTARGEVVMVPIRTTHGNTQKGVV